MTAAFLHANAVTMVLQCIGKIHSKRERRYLGLSHATC